MGAAEVRRDGSRGSSPEEGWRGTSGLACDAELKKRRSQALFALAEGHEHVFAPMGVQMTLPGIIIEVF